MPQTDPLQVVYVVTDQVVDKYASILKHLCVGMIDEAINITIVAATRRLEEFFVGPVNIIQHQLRRWFAGTRPLKAVIEQISATPDVVHALACDGARFSAELAKHFKADLVLQVAGTNDAAIYRGMTASDVSAMPAFTEPLADRLAAELRGMPVEVIRPGIHTLKAPTCFKVGDHIPTLLVQCSLSAQSGLNEILEAVARLTGEGVPLMLFVLGLGPKESAYRRRAAELKIGPHVTFAGHVREWSNVLQGADIFIGVRPSSVFDVRPLEAMAAGMAAVVCPGGIEDYFHDEQTVLLASPASADGLYRSLRRLLEDPVFAKNLAANAQKYVKTHHPPSAMVSGYAQLYRKLVLKRRTIPMPPPGEATGSGEE